MCAITKGPGSYKKEWFHWKKSINFLPEAWEPTQQCRKALWVEEVFCFLIKVQGGVSAQRKKKLEIHVQDTCTIYIIFPLIRLKRRQLWSTGDKLSLPVMSRALLLNWGVDVRRLCCCQYVTNIKLAQRDMTLEWAEWRRKRKQKIEKKR